MCRMTFLYITSEQPIDKSVRWAKRQQEFSGIYVIVDWINCDFFLTYRNIISNFNLSNALNVIFNNINNNILK